MPFEKGMALFELVYGFRPDLDAAAGERTEFSIHPRPMGWKQTHTLLWEHEEGVPEVSHTSIGWPNNFSRMIGDKAFGLVIAHLAGACDHSPSADLPVTSKCGHVPAPQNNNRASIQPSRDGSIPSP